MKLATQQELSTVKKHLNWGMGVTCKKNEFKCGWTLGDKKQEIRDALCSDAPKAVFFDKLLNEYQVIVYRSVNGWAEETVRYAIPFSPDAVR